MSFYGVRLLDVLPDPTTVSRHLEGVVIEEKQKLIKQVSSIEVFGVTTDLWTHPHTNDGYITVTVQYVDIQGGWHVRSQILLIRVMNERHTAINVRSCVQDILSGVRRCQTGKRICHRQRQQYGGCIPKKHLAF